MLCIVAARSSNGVIGKQNALPWYLPADLRRFKELTTGQTVIMGRKTYESIVQRLGHALPNRTNIVLTSDKSLVAPDIQVAGNLQDALKLAATEDVFVIGGEAVFAEALPLADILYLTEVQADIDGDVYFPPVHEQDWTETEHDAYQKDEKNEYDYDFVTLQRSTPADGGYNLAVARSETQRQQMRDLASRGVCAFCPENIASEQREPVELETEHWLVKHNDYPYENTKLHLLVVPKRHSRTFSHLPPEAQQSFGEIITAVEKQWQLTSYALGMRSGDMRYNGGSVEHLHAHIIVGDTDQPEHQPVRFKMSSRPA